MNHIKDTAETIINSGRAVGKGMSFIERFWLKKNGPGITIFVVVLAGFITAIVFYNNGMADGKENSIAEIRSLIEAGKTDSLQIKRLKSDNLELQKQLDTCNKSSTTANLEDLVNKKLEEAERLKRILERKITNDEKLHKNLKDILP